MKFKDDCIFCKIVKGENNAYKIYEDGKVLAFLDIRPVTKGHTLVVPKEHYKNIYEIPGEELSNVTMVTKKLADKYKDILKPRGMNLLQANERIAGQTVFHFHMHLVPRYENDGVETWFHRYSKPNENLEEVFQTIMNGIHDAH